MKSTLEGDKKSSLAVYHDFGAYDLKKRAIVEIIVQYLKEQQSKGGVTGDVSIRTVNTGDNINLLIWTGFEKDDIDHNDVDISVEKLILDTFNTMKGKDLTEDLKSRALTLDDDYEDFDSMSNEMFSQF